MKFQMVKNEMMATQIVGIDDRAHAPKSLLESESTLHSKQVSDIRTEETASEIQFLLLRFETMQTTWVETAEVHHAKLKQDIREYILQVELIHAQLLTQDLLLQVAASILWSLRSSLCLIRRCLIRQLKIMIWLWVSQDQTLHTPSLGLLPLTRINLLWVSLPLQ